MGTDISPSDILPISDVLEWFLLSCTCCRIVQLYLLMHMDREKTRVSGLLCGIICMFLGLAILIQCQHLTDRHTQWHTHTDTRYCAGIASRGKNVIFCATVQHLQDSHWHSTSYSPFVIAEFVVYSSLHCLLLFWHWCMVTCVIWCSITVNHQQKKKLAASASGPSSPRERGSAKKKTKSSKTQAEAKQHDAVVCII